MKFLTKINYNYLFLLSLSLIVVSLSGYIMLRSLILNETKENFTAKAGLIEKQIRETGTFPNMYPLIEVEMISDITQSGPQYKEIFIHETREENDVHEIEIEPYLEYSNQLEINGNYYSLKLRQSDLESRDLMIILAISLFILLLAALGVSFIFTRKMNKSIWVDFERNLHEIEHFSFRENADLRLSVSDIEEFDRLNKVLTNLTNKLKRDYLSLKEFTENASHEIQTPLAIALLNLEEILQQDINAETFEKVVSTINALKLLSSLNRSLLLLTKIENGQYQSQETVNINALLQRKIEEFEPLFDAGKLKVTLHDDQEFLVHIDQRLAEIVINNLLSNAVKHNIPNGYIEIRITTGELRMCNSGKENTLRDDTIFDRFVKGSSASNGLGLAIVHTICKTYGLKIRYTKNDDHCFTITFNHEK